MAASNPDAKFVFNYLSEDNYLVNLDKTDEEFITDYIAAEYGICLVQVLHDAPYCIRRCICFAELVGLHKKRSIMCVRT